MFILCGHLPLQLPYAAPSPSRVGRALIGVEIYPAVTGTIFPVFPSISTTHASLLPPRSSSLPPPADSALQISPADRAANPQRASRGPPSLAACLLSSLHRTWPRGTPQKEPLLCSSVPPWTGHRPHHSPPSSLSISQSRNRGPHSGGYSMVACAGCRSTFPHGTWTKWGRLR